MSSPAKNNKEDSVPIVDGGVYYGFAPSGTSSMMISVPQMPAFPQVDSATQARQESDLGESLYKQGRHQEAMARFTRAIQIQPDEAKYHYHYACAAWNTGETTLVEKHFLLAIDLHPGEVCVHHAMALWYLQQDQGNKALKHAQAAVTLDPESDDVAILMGEVLGALGRYDEAYAKLKPLIDRKRYGSFLARTVGKLALKAGREAKAMEVIESTLRFPTLQPYEKSQLHAALSPLLEKLGRYDEAFAHAKTAKLITRPPYDPRVSTLNASKCIQFFTREHFQALPRASHGNTRPVFIVGMPRSGTSLVEQILASHPAVFGAGELSRLSEIIQPGAVEAWADGRPYPHYLDNLSVPAANQMANEYLKTINAMNNSATLVTDKMPQNFIHLGVAQILFPQCKVIHCMRDPRDTGLSCFMTSFLAGQEFANDLSHIAQYYRDYERLMAHWKTVLDLPMLDVRYEDVVADQEGQSRRMLEFLGLPWDANCMKFHQTHRAVPTASREQVRKPIYNSSIGRWKRYEKHIPELLSLADPMAK